MRTMRFVVAASSDAMVQECRRALGHVPGTAFRTGSVPETGAGCDAAVLNSPLAHERYGGVPRIGSVQVLLNQRGDGAPEVILATAPMAAGAAVPDPGDDQIASHVSQTLDACVAAFVEAFPDRAGEACVLLHLEGAGIDREDIAVTLKGLLRFLLERE
ncbi:hypothetical protein ABZ802_13575 [Streptomyces sp. NPDC047737]|uniref:hypothetical protein n=1 Tax=unclassified Streptomyces TaxID=2593676 RepID=UPI0033F40C5E